MGSDDNLNNAHLMRMAGRFSRRVRAHAKAHQIPLKDCAPGERKHEIAEEYLPKDANFTGVFLILVARAPAPVWDAQCSKSGKIVNLAKKFPYVNHYSFHTLDPDWGHVIIKRKASNLPRKAIVSPRFPIAHGWRKSQTPCLLQIS